MATSHPTCLDDVAVGRLGKVLMYQSSGRLFHCYICFDTSRDFSKIFKHIITKHCMAKREEVEEGGVVGEGSEKGEEEVEKDAPDKRSSDVEEANDGAKDTLKRKRNGEGEENEEEQNEESVSVKPQDEKKNALMFDGLTYCCLICGWRTKTKSASVSHLVRKHDLHKKYAAQVIRQDVASIGQRRGGGAEDEEAPGLSKELLKEEIEATSKVLNYIGSRYICQICGWRTKVKDSDVKPVGSLLILM
ncbi:uncharacterized protein LOC119429062 [Nematolebias whitei]|uniref:uncharacterized protein LOC119429062 n=1 Tax=Nematolebias whitei TaxID=451745 RepID=UPI001897DFEC|nr:uncharacterized protein LOC119429062 [Nematolebias whitei]